MSVCLSVFYAFPDLISIVIIVSKFTNLAVDISVSTFLYQHFCTNISVPTFLYQNFYIKISVSKFLYQHFCTNISVPTFLYQHSLPGIKYLTYLQFLDI
jgi:hypothetical protein